MDNIGYYFLELTYCVSFTPHSILVIISSTPATKLTKFVGKHHYFHKLNTIVLTFIYQIYQLQGVKIHGSKT